MEPKHPEGMGPVGRTPALRTGVVFLQLFLGYYLYHLSMEYLRLHNGIP